MSAGFTVTEEVPDRKYFTMVPNYIINHSTIWERDVYLIMKRIAGEDGNCFASHQTIADMTGVSRPTISRTIKKLLKRGWIKETGKVPGKTHPTKNYIIADLWKENFAFYETEKKRKLQNQSSQITKDTSTTEPKIRKPQIYKEEPIGRRTNTLSIAKRKFSLKEIPDKELENISNLYQVPLPFVRSKYDDLVNYCARTGKTYRDYVAALRNFVKQDALKIRQKPAYDRKQGIDASNI